MQRAKLYVCTGGHRHTHLQSCAYMFCFVLKAIHPFAGSVTILTAISSDLSELTSLAGSGQLAQTKFQDGPSKKETSLTLLLVACFSV